MNRKLLFFAGIFSVLPMFGQVYQLTPRVDCSQSIGVAYFGYISLEADTKRIDAGDSNNFIEPPQQRGQPTHFDPGVHHYVYKSFFDSQGSLTWNLQDQFAQAEVPGRNTSALLPICPAALITSNFGVIGLSSGQTLRLKAVANAGGAACTLGFQDLNGNSIGPAPVTQGLNYGNAFTLDLTSTMLGLGLGKRAEIRPVLTTQYGTSFLSCQATAEVFGTTSGVTAATEKLQIPQIQPVFDMQGLAAGQTLRLSVSSISGQPACSGTLSFTDPSNSPVGGTLPFNLTGGQSAYLDLASASIPGSSGWLGKRAEFRPVVTLPADGSAVCLTTVQSFITLTGLTQTISLAEPLP